ncbi:hypothetical protein [Bradyrhizobium sp. CCBAU 51753]|uniref:hypothetical protein n=1 Tax=Bradyrhizobium sp. CCBAU 51753 TaxID=1325100 RepID=UPI00188C3967|nr:hypothetical protein [Bradyrhizobium sp. CCBAU 51753]QOZ25274.1 hypothetical protein XH93_18020 [Bradyrhizobium sp. CCBAU 51753]
MRTCAEVRLYTSLGLEAHVAGVVEPVLSPAARQVWRWFCQMHDLRDYSRITEPVTMPDQRLGWQVKSKVLRLHPERIEAWMRLRAIVPEQWHLAALDLIDEIYVKLKNDPPPPAVAATGANILAMFRALGMKSKTKALRDGRPPSDKP